jgi:regulator of cell morphogenesis and NO signaling
MTRHGEMLLRDLANAGESARRALDRAGLDFCCAGDQTLTRACEVAGVDAVALEHEIDARELEEGDPWAERGVTELIDHLVAVVHPKTKRLLEELMALGARLPKQSTVAREISDAIEVLAWQVRFQMNEEEQGIFARARALAEARQGRGPFPLTLRTMHEHRTHLHEAHAATHQQLRRLRALIGNLEAPDRERLRACAEAAAAALMEQIHLENNELVPLALDLEPNGQAGTDPTRPES